MCRVRSLGLLDETAIDLQTLKESIVWVLVSHNDVSVVSEAVRVFVIKTAKLKIIGSKYKLLAV